MAIERFWIIGISDAYYCAECTRLERDRDGCPKIVNLGASRTDLFYERRRLGTSMFLFLLLSLYEVLTDTFIRFQERVEVRCSGFRITKVCQRLGYCSESLPLINWFYCAFMAIGQVMGFEWALNPFGIPCSWRVQVGGCKCGNGSESAPSIMDRAHASALPYTFFCL